MKWEFHKEMEVLKQLNLKMKPELRAQQANLKAQVKPYQQKKKSSRNWNIIIDEIEKLDHLRKKINHMKEICRNFWDTVKKQSLQIRKNVRFLA